MVPLIFLCIQLAFAVLILFLTIAFVTGAPFVPSTKATAGAMIEFAHIKPGMMVYDLGSGDGRLLFMAAKRGAKAVGLEINPFLVFLTWVRIMLSPYRGKITVRWRSFWQTDLSDADVVFVYLLPWKMDKLAIKLKRELKPGALIVSNSFVFPNWTSLRQHSDLHVYVFQKEHLTR